jgi:hypothetical protein
MRSPFLQTVYFEYYVSFSLVDEKKRVEEKKYKRTTPQSVFPAVVLVSITIRRALRSRLKSGLRFDGVGNTKNTKLSLTTSFELLFLFFLSAEETSELLAPV